MKNTQVARLLTYMTRMVNQQVLLQNEYLAAENRILRAHLPARLRLTDPQRATWQKSASVSAAELSKSQELDREAKPDTILAWYRKLIAQKFDGSRYRRYPGRPSVSLAITELVLRIARENIAWG
jgi:putative transposase